jgi:cytochrome c oxidase assembly factor CtaG
MLSWARHYEFVQAVQFAIFAVIAPVFANLGDVAGRFVSRAHSIRWSVLSLTVYGASAVFWRTPWCVDALAHHGWLVVLEALSVTLIGTWAWSALVSSPRLPARLTPAQRLAAAALVMWTIWVMAYLVGLSHNSWYRAYDHGGWLSVSADQQLTTGLLWALSGAAFVPIVFWNLYNWLRHENSADDELAERIKSSRLGSSTN